MKLFATLALLALGAGTYRGLAQSSDPEPHQWLQQLAGTWTGTAVATPPGAEPIHYEVQESVRSLGGLWTVAEGSAAPGGMAVSSILTLGYDPRKEEFVGTWIDSVQTTLWSYRGTLDAAKQVLTLETEGPSFADESRTSRYRDALELKSADHKVLTSSVQRADGTWLTFLRVEYRRK